MTGHNIWTQYADFLRDRHTDVLAAAGEHVMISAIAVIAGAAVAVPLGIYLSQSKIKWIQSVVFTIANIFQTIPSLALLALLIPLLGIGTKPAVFALFLYSLLPILRNTYTGFHSVDPSVLESARGMGYGRMQRIMHVQLPLAMPYVMSGLRMTTVYVISWTTLATLIGAGGLGDLIVAGIGVNKKELIFSGAAVAIILALLADWLLGAVEKRVTRKAKPVGAARTVS
ncbi:ABC transporter permease [Paenibacillus doosanensis]|uniref:Glycine betaine/carnitine/choline transport system permease protein OpuCB n=1 Tax=Paenibacillus konkukensis TaxID=2020716 RepID=A0ABY4RLC8_9BACL|nr:MULTISPECIES: ABC transporter permease [Paenibacillus]MCS7460177.1 ABC transporter permease [Paenibacillus doosanensis]UQZ82835.1 Glycine betaine/carnitine/choline transport system permease protein OpuCB [Paenibacillus konkukensis]